MSYTNKAWNQIALNISKIPDKELRDFVCNFCCENFKQINHSFSSSRFIEYVTNCVNIKNIDEES